MKPFLAMALVLTAPLLLDGCGGDTPTKPKSPSELVYPVRSTPKNAILYLAMAFASRDSVRTDSVYADDYQGSSIDMADPSPVTIQFSKVDEVRAVGAMSLSSTATFVSMDLSPPGTWLQVHYASDPPAWATIQIPSFRIEVHDSQGNGFTAQPSSGETWVFEFTLKPTTPDATSPTDTTWTIVRWVESRANL